MHIIPLAKKLDYTVVFEYIKPPRPSAATLWWMLAAILGAALVFVAFELISRRIGKNRARRRSEENFNQLTLVCRLAPDEIKLLKHLIGVCNIKFPDRLFTSFELFNSCLEEDGPGASAPVSETDTMRLRIIRNKIFFGERSKLPPIKTTRELKSSQRLHLKRISSGEVFVAPVVETGVSGLLVATPRVQGKHLQVEPGERFDIYFWRNGDASYHFETEAIGQSETHRIITIFKHVEDMERIQRRQYHRIDTSIKVDAIPVTREELDRISQGEEVDTKGHPGLRAHVVDLSGAGFALAARAPLSANHLVYVELPANGGDARIPIIGKILNVTTRKRTEESLMHAEFAGLSAESHERIFQYIYFHAGPETLSAV